MAGTREIVAHLLLTCCSLPVSKCNFRSASGFFRSLPVSGFYMVLIISWLVGGSPVYWFGFFCFRCYPALNVPWFGELATTTNMCFVAGIDASCLSKKYE